MKKDTFIVLTSFLLPLLLIVSLCIFFHKDTKRDGRGQNSVTHGNKPDPAKCEHPDGIDLSHWNVAYDWKKVDTKFVYVRASFGASIKDRRYDIHRKAADRHQIPVGAYHFLVANKSAKEQFDFFKSIAKKEHMTLRPMLDIEESEDWKAPKGFTDQDAHRFIREWCDLCRRHYGKAPIIYTTEKLYERYALNKGFEDCIWWVANHNNIDNYDKHCKIPYTIHQYSDEKYVEGFYGPVDCNRFRKGKSVKDLKL